MPCGTLPTPSCIELFPFHPAFLVTSLKIVKNTEQFSTTICSFSPQNWCRTRCQIYYSLLPTCDSPFSAYPCLSQSPLNVTICWYHHLRQLIPSICHNLLWKTFPMHLCKVSPSNLKALEKKSTLSVPLFYQFFHQPPEKTSLANLFFSLIDSNPVSILVYYFCTL